MTRLPQLEQELVAAAARLQGPRRVVGPAVRAALAAAAVVVLVGAGVLLAAGDDGGPGRPQPAAALPFPRDATLEDMLGVFRRAATPADDMGFSKDDFDEISDRQPGEDPTRSRRVDWPSATIFLWPMRDGVCYGVGGGGGCVPLDLLRRLGVSVGIHSSAQRQSVSGVVVDGIREVVLTASGGPDLQVPVRENFFFVDVNSAAKKLESPGWETRVQEVRWRYGGEERTLDVGHLLQRANPRVEPLAESASEPLEFRVAATRYTAVGFQTSRSAVCTTLTQVDAGQAPATGCLSERLLRDALKEQPAHRYAAGGAADGMVHSGFARAEVVEITPEARSSDITVILSKPWRPEPWKGEPIRYFFAFEPDEPAPPGRRPDLPLTARLNDGRNVQIP